MFKLNPIILVNETFISFTNNFYTRNDIVMTYEPKRWIIPKVGLFYPAMMGDDAILDALGEYDQLKDYCREHPIPSATRGYLVIPDKQRIVKVVYHESEGLVYDSFDIRHHPFIALAPYGDIEAYLSTSLAILKNKGHNGNVLLTKMEGVIEKAMLKADNIYQERIEWNAVYQLVKSPLLEIQRTKKVWALG